MTDPTPLRMHGKDRHTALGVARALERGERVELAIGHRQDPMRWSALILQMGADPTVMGDRLVIVQAGAVVWPHDA